ncbi:AzlD domain-containing protein [Brachybacterium sp. J153]|uniref:AzlD domain-containing protein n=1 Tax=Brachybacterium sp. J153 TaxID=3116488 RepID=UPI002E75E540|nr:AzlD domain-containing protein [Brachybacterium sp. J153]MEE1618836.1 AzlD domain-containing protein [Brachybacterium sp. J153]
MSVLWIGVVLASLVSFGQKWIGYQVPSETLDRPRVSRITALLPIALLGALVAVQAATSGTVLVADARLVALLAAAVLLLLRAPFLVVVIGAAATAAVLRALGWS